jgi:hypothetical protein
MQHSRRRGWEPDWWRKHQYRYSACARIAPRVGGLGSYFGRDSAVILGPLLRMRELPSAISEGQYGRETGDWDTWFVNANLQRFGEACEEAKSRRGP